MVMMVMDQKRRKGHLQYSSEAAIRSERWNETDKSRRLIEVADALARQCDSMHVQVFHPHPQPRSRSRSSQQETSGLSHDFVPYETYSSSKACEQIFLRRASRHEIQRHRTSRVSQSRGRSRCSPRKVPVSKLYRTRSLVEEDTGKSAVPFQRTTFLQGEDAKGVASLEYPAYDRFEYGKERGMRRRYQPYGEFSGIERLHARGFPREHTDYVMVQSKEYIVQRDTFILSLQIPSRLPTRLTGN